MMRMSHVDGKHLFILRKTKSLCFLVRSMEDGRVEKEGFKAVERSDI